MSCLQLSFRLPISLSINGFFDLWLTFHDTFHSLIHCDSRLSNVQKFHYLKSCLKGDASQTIHSPTISTTNYEAAWNILKDRYDNKKLIVEDHIKILFNLPNVQIVAQNTFRSVFKACQSTWSYRSTYNWHFVNLLANVKTRVHHSRQVGRIYIKNSISFTTGFDQFPPRQMSGFGMQNKRMNQDDVTPFEVCQLENL